MKNIPERIYLDLGFEPSEDDDFNVCDDVTWSKDNATGNGVEYVRKDIAEDFAEFVLIKKYGEEMNRGYKNRLFEEFLKNRNI